MATAQSSKDSYPIFFISQNVCLFYSFFNKLYISKIICPLFTIHFQTLWVYPINLRPWCVLAHQVIVPTGTETHGQNWRVTAEQCTTTSDALLTQRPDWNWSTGIFFECSLCPRNPHAVRKPQLLCDRNLIDVERNTSLSWLPPLLFYMPFEAIGEMEGYSFAMHDAFLCL